MPIVIDRNIPAYSVLNAERIFVMDSERATSQDIRPIEIAILNLMPTKIETETQFMRLLSNSPLQVNVTLIHTESYRSKKERAAEAAQKERIKRIEAAISQNEGEEAEISAKLADPAVTADYREVERLCRRLDELKREQEELYAEYDKLI